MKQKIVVLGGVGLVGTHLCRRLIPTGAEIYCIDTRDIASSPLLHEIAGADNFHFIRHNITVPYNIRCGAIYNLVAPTPLHYARTLPVETLRLHIEGAINTLETARAEFARVVYASSAAVYSPTAQIYPAADRTLSERTATAEGKRTAEAIHYAYSQEYDVDVRIARLFNTYGTSCDLSDQRVIMRMISAALQNRDLQIYGNGEQLRTFCWAGDAADALVRLMTCEGGCTQRAIDIGSDREITIRALAELIIELTGSRSRIVHIEARRYDSRSRMPDLTIARKELGWAPATPLAEGLRQTIAYVENVLREQALASRTWVEVH